MRLIQLISKESRPVNIHDCKYATRQGIEILFATNTFVSAVQTINALIMSREGREKRMYSVNIYEDFKDGSFKFLETYYCYAHNRAEAKLIALRYAEEKYPDRKISVMNVN